GGGNRLAIRRIGHGVHLATGRRLVEQLAFGREVPQMQRGPIGGRCQGLAVAGKGEGVGASRRAAGSLLELLQRLAGAYVPNGDLIVTGRGSEPVAVGRKDRRDDYRV